MEEKDQDNNWVFVGQVHWRSKGNYAEGGNCCGGMKDLFAKNVFGRVVYTTGYNHHTITCTYKNSKYCKEKRFCLQWGNQLLLSSATRFCASRHRCEIRAT